MPMSISRGGKPSKPRIAKRDADGNLSFLHRLQVVSVPLLTGDVIGAGYIVLELFQPLCSPVTSLEKKEKI